MTIEEGESGEDLGEAVEAIGEDPAVIGEAVVGEDPAVEAVGEDLAALSEAAVAEADAEEKRRLGRRSVRIQPGRQSATIQRWTR
jgi:hypothetical protein